MQRRVLGSQLDGANGMNMSAIAYVALGLLAFPLCVIGITALAGGMLVRGRFGREHKRRPDRPASLPECLPPCPAQTGCDAARSQDVQLIPRKQPAHVAPPTS